MSQHWKGRDSTLEIPRILLRYSPTHGINKIVQRLETEPKHQSLGTVTRAELESRALHVYTWVHVLCTKDVEIVLSLLTATKGSGVSESSADMWIQAAPPPSTSRCKHSCQVGYSPG